MVGKQLSLSVWDLCGGSVYPARASPDLPVDVLRAERSPAQNYPAHAHYYYIHRGKIGPLPRLRGIVVGVVLIRPEMLSAKNRAFVSPRKLRRCFSSKQEYTEVTVVAQILITAVIPHTDYQGRWCFHGGDKSPRS